MGDLLAERNGVLLAQVDLILIGTSTAIGRVSARA